MARAVLIVDDDRAVRAIAAELLRDEGYRVAVADTAEGGLEALEQHGVDLVLLDHGVGQPDGCDFVGRARGLAAARPAILLWTAWPGAEAAAARMGADGALPKPVDLDALLDAVRRQIGGP